MFKITNGELTMDNCDFDHTAGRVIDEGIAPIEALREELEFCGLDIKDVVSVKLSLENIREMNIESIKIYLKEVQDYIRTKETTEE